MLTDIDTLIFDAEGVVLDTEGAWDLAQAELLRIRGRAYQRTTVKPLLTGLSGYDAVTVLKNHYQLTDDVEALVAERNAHMRAFLTDGARYVPGFTDFYALTKDRFSTCVATAMDDDLFALANSALDIRKLFNGHVYTMGEVACRSKPAPDLFLHAAAQLGAPPHRCLVIEDAPYGIQAAKAAGMRCVGLATTYAPERLAAADVVFSSWREGELAVIEWDGVRGQLGHESGTKSGRKTAS